MFSESAASAIRIGIGFVIDNEKEVGASDLPNTGNSACKDSGDYLNGSVGSIIPFSAFWLRSSVVSVLNSLISITSLIETSILI